MFRFAVPLIRFSQNGCTGRNEIVTQLQKWRELYADTYCSSLPSVIGGNAFENAFENALPPLSDGNELQYVSA